MTKKIKYGSYERWFLSKYGSYAEKQEVKKQIAQNKQAKYDKNKNTKSEPVKKKKNSKKPKIKSTFPDKDSATYIWIQNNCKKLINNTTKEELELYSVLDTLDIPFEKQYPFCINHKIFFADAVFLKTKTIIEVDGGYHKSPSVAKKDIERTKLLNGIGYKVIRIDNDDIYDRCIIYSKLEKHMPIKINAYQIIDD